LVAVGISELRDGLVTRESSFGLEYVAPKLVELVTLGKLLGGRLNFGVLIN